MEKKKFRCLSRKDIKPGFILKQLSFSLLFLLIPVIAWSQEVTGTVTDAQNGEPLPGVHVIIVGTTTGTVTNIDGNYSITVPSLDRSLHFTFIGYQPVVVRLDGRTEVSVTMDISAIMGQEVIVTGYGTVRQRETISGSVSAVSGDRLERVPTANLSNTLAGRVSGLAGVNFSGEPGYDGSTIRIRGNATLGNNNPLIVIDGVPARQGGLERLNPHDIENVSVLKDASAAIYGSRAANGVILITTRRGRSGTPRFQANVSQGFNRPTVVPNMANAATYLTMVNEIDMYAGRDPRTPAEEIERYRNIADQDPWLYTDTDWFAEGLKPFSNETEASMSISGGAENVRYRVSLRGLTEDAYYTNSATRYDQYEFRTNLDIDVNENIQVGGNVAGRYEDRNFPTQSAGNQFRMLMRGYPHRHAVWPDGRPGPDIEYGTNPIVSASPETGHHSIDDYYVQTNLYTTVNIPAIEGLSIRGHVAYDRRFQENDMWSTPWTLYTWGGYVDGEPTLNAGSRGPGTPRLNSTRSGWTDVTMNLVGSYQRSFDDHNVAFLIGTERETWNGQNLGAYREGYITAQFPQMNLGAQENRRNSGSSWHGARQNYFSRVNYDFNGTYLLELVARFDGSYIFPAGDRYGFFPSASVGWRLSNENWFQDATNDIFNSFIVRTSYGRTGNDQVAPYQFLGTYGFGSGYIFNYATIRPTLFEARIPNPTITWEVANQFNAGLNMAVLDNSISLELDYFNYLREGILWRRDAALPHMAGFTLPDENIGEVKSYGVESTLTYMQGFGQNLFLNARFITSYAENEILFFDEPDGIPEWQRNEGRPMNTGLYYNVIGVFQSEEEIANTPSWPGAMPGDLIFEDKDGDGVITANDRYRETRTNFPKWTYGLELSGTYRQWNFTTFWQAATGAVVYQLTESGEIGNYTQSFADNRWTPDNPTNEHPRTWNRSDQYWSANGNTYFLRSTDYIRLRSIDIAYSLPVSLTQGLGVERVQFSISGYNLLTFTGLEDLDPEASSGAGQYYPQRRSIRAGLSLTF